MTVSAEGVPLRERQRQEREALILRAAADLFVEKGFHETSMEDIAARVGIAKGTVYLHFASKEDLVIAFCEQGIRKFAIVLDTIVAGTGTPRAKLERIFAGALTPRHEGISQVIGTAFHNPQMLARMQEQRERMGDLWREPSKSLSALFDEGKATGDFDPTMPTPLMLSLFLGLLAPHNWERGLANDMTLAETARHVTRFYFKGVAPDQSLAPPAPTTAPLEPTES
jgi:AcrR family transcriptional regulator